MLVGWRRTVSKCFIIPQRVVLSIMGFLAIVNAYTMRICLNVAITEMTFKNSSGDPEDKLDGTCPMDPNSPGGGGSNGTFEWDEKLQGIILGAFFWGYVITHVPGGLLSERFGGKYTLCLGILSTAIFTLITPVVINWGGAPWLIALRFLEGLGEGTTFPALSALLAAWVPPKERAKLGSFVFGGGQVGTIVGTALSGVLISYFESWESVFYFFGIVAIIWFIAFVLICYKDPESHPFIKEEEKEYLRKEMGILGRDKNLPPTPWRAILTSVPMMALVCAQIGHDFGFYIMATDLPKYMSDVLHFSIKQNGFYSSLPYALMWVSSIGMGFICDWMINKKWINVTNSRKLYTTIASVGPAIFIVAASYAGCNRALVITLFTLAMGTMGGFYPGMKLGPLDMSPNYAGTIMAVTNGIGALTGILGPFLVGVLTPNTTVYEWRVVFWIAFGVFNVTNIVYVIWASGEIQPWNEPHLLTKSRGSLSLSSDEETQKNSNAVSFFEEKQRDTKGTTF